MVHVALCSNAVADVASVCAGQQKGDAVDTPQEGGG